MTPVPAEPTTPPERRAVDDPVDARDVVWAHRFQRASRLRRGVVVVIAVAWLGHAAVDVVRRRLDGCEARRETRLQALHTALRAGAALPEGVLFPAPTPTSPTTQVLALDDGAALVRDNAIVGGGPVCPRP